MRRRPVSTSHRPAALSVSGWQSGARYALVVQEVYALLLVCLSAHAERLSP
jgi:hypothetical protein